MTEQALRMGDRGYPRPQLVRDGWVNLVGEWEFAIDADARWRRPSEVTWSARIRVPFAPETVRSGIARTDYFHACWYRRRIELPRRAPGERLMLRFGAVDYRADVWADGQWCGEHEGGYTPF